MPAKSSSHFFPNIRMRWLERALRASRSLYGECSASVREAKGFRSCLQLSQDFAISRLLKYIPKRFRNRERQVELRNGVKLRYRLNRGDIQGIREVWLEHAYRLAFPISNGVLVDLGANIGLTSVWLAKKYGFAKVIAVEPDPGNAALARKNFDLNGISGKILEAAIGPYDGMTRFQAAEESNLGRLSNEGKLVMSISMRSVLNRYRLSEVDLVKIDIEGGEAALLTGPSEWLCRTKAIIAEFHPDVIDYPALTQLLEHHGFYHIRPGTAFANNMDSFLRSNR
jgi:FkbM family methyltransferase